MAIENQFRVRIVHAGRMILTSTFGHVHVRRIGKVWLIVMMDQCEVLHVEYNTLTPVVIVGTNDKQHVLHVECNPPDRFSVVESFVTKICYHPSRAINIARQPLNLTAPFLPQTPLSNSIAVRTPIVSTAVGNRSTELVAPRDAFLKNRCVPVEQTVSTWAAVVQSLFQR